MNYRRLLILLVCILSLIFFTSCSRSPEQLREKLVDEAREGDIASIKTLLKKGADINGKDRSGFTTLYRAAGMGKTETVKFLLANGAVDVPCLYGWTALKVAAENGITEIVEVLLLEKSATVTDKNNALYWAALNGRYSTVQFLLEKGANPNTSNIYGKSHSVLLTRLIELKQTAIVKLFIDKGANVNEKGEYGYTPLKLAKEKGYSDIVQLLKQAGAKE